MRITQKINTEKLTLNEILFQVAFLINKNNFESAFSLVQTNGIQLTDLSQDKSIEKLDEFRKFVKDQFQCVKSS